MSQAKLHMQSGRLASYLCLCILQWDACETCFVDIEVTHPKHDFVALRKSSDHYRAPQSGSGDFLGRALGLVGSEGSMRHPRVVCDGKLQPFFNLKHKLNCCYLRL